MFFHRCDKCGCPLDPGEGRMCDDCIMAKERKEPGAAAVEDLLRSCMEYQFIQMEMEDFLNG